MTKKIIKKENKLAYVEEPRTNECIRECGEVLPCTCTRVPECYCVCQKHPIPTLNINALKELSGGEVIEARQLFKN